MTWHPVDLDAPNVEYVAYLASLGNPDHHVMLGVDWWGCLCWAGGNAHYTYTAVAQDAKDHADKNGAELVAVGYSYEHVEDVGPTKADLHEFLWCEGVFG